MTDPAELLRRAAELNDWADNEEDVEVRDRLLKMADYYERIARKEEWQAAHPTSIASLTGLLNKPD
jgi:hypothetical protein